MALSNADRQRRYRENHRKAQPAPKAPRDAPPLAVALRRITELEDEVSHLKRLLAERPTIGTVSPRPTVDLTGYGSRFGAPRPAPKPSRSRTSRSGPRG